ncbi:uncharacterized protein CIMG_01073 [Coccidioides immitis RS]|uniref:Uncharacterized protein n=3 Tax=Coccidioides immitis TaxID=5501 RepID=J3KID3_COCIM|nr:uncharacterized protein CIMG_01073 [Coccidioides immitis RS]EAS35719.3 hypothetical protein CIMG_01073 [Coccidioides immitis RS]KMP01000.1 hypothetical protein CIRG_01140 [Coccidioides immitis RMSCC 2394]KMU83511.1 hypothetical protein CIHG_01293 [Coccidioides immitis H538.4]TPX26058.1 hypothetical protein DIZ76_011517 [Coccidioides immitis]
MSICRHVCRRACQQQDGPIANHVWISDALLTRSFTEFTRTQRRYGSNVPGPLEARRRLAKRRNADLAMAGYGGAGIDPAILFGQNPEGHKQFEFPFGSFLSGQDPSTVSPLPFNSLPGTATPAQTLNAPPFLSPDLLGLASTQNWDKIFTRVLPKTCCLDDIRDLVSYLGVDLRSHPQLSQLILNHIIGVYRKGTWPLTQISDFLGDPYLNPRGSNNFVAVVRALVSKPGTKVEVEAIFQMLRFQLSLGLVPRHEIPLMLKLVPRIRTSDIRPESPGVLHTFCFEAIWQGIELCSVVQPKDLGNRTLSSWLGLLSRGNATGRSALLSKDIIRLLAGSRASYSPGLQTVSLQIVKLIATHTKSTALIYWKHFRNFIQYFNDVGNLFPSRLLMDSIFRVTKSLLFSRQYRKTRRKLLRIWSDILEHSNLSFLLHEAHWDFSRQGWLSSRMTRKMPRARLSRNREHRLMRKEWLLRLWLVKVLDRKARVERRRRQLFGKLLAYDKRLRGPRPKVDLVSYLDRSMQMLGGLGLPHADAVSITSTQMRYEQRMLNYPHIPKNAIQALSRVELSGLRSNVFRENDPHRLLEDEMFCYWEDMARKIDVTAPDFANKILLYTETNSPLRSGLLRILRRHTPFKIALAYSWNPCRRYSDVEPHGGQKYASEGYPVLNPADCLATMHSIALIFACSSKLSPRNAYRLTRWCFEFLLDHNAPITPTMVRALYHAGIYRFREAGMSVPQARFSYIINHVREVEGDAIASALASGVPFEVTYLLGKN